MTSIVITVPQAILLSALLSDGTVTITGTNFHPSARILLGDYEPVTTYVNSGSLTCEYAGALTPGTAYAVTYLDDNQTVVSPDLFTIAPAVISGITSPITNEGDTELTVDGSDLDPSAVITLGAAYQPVVTFVNAATLHAQYVSDSLVPGTYDVTYTDANGQESILHNGLVIEPV